MSKKDFAAGTATLLGTGVFIIGARAISEEITKQQIRAQEREEKLKNSEENSSSYLSGDGAAPLKDNPIYIR